MPFDFEQKLQSYINDLAKRVVEAYAVRRPDADLQDFWREIADPAMQRVLLENGEQLYSIANLMGNDVSQERAALLICCGFLAQAQAELDVKSLETASVLVIDGFFWLGLLHGLQSNGNAEKKARSELGRQGSLAMHKQKYGKLKDFVKVVARSKPIGEWESLAQAARIITALMFMCEDSLGQRLATEEPVKRVEKWLAEIEERADLFNYSARNVRKKS